MATEDEKIAREKGTARTAVDDLLASMTRIHRQPEFPSDEDEQENLPSIDAAFPRAAALRVKREKELKEQWEQALRGHVNDVWRWNRARNDASSKAGREEPSWDDYISFDKIEELTKESGRVPKAAFAFAVEEKMVGLMEKLVELGAKPTAYNLITAIKGENQFIVRHLLDMGAKPDQKVIDYIAERLEAKGQPIDELIDRAVREMDDDSLHVLLATGTSPREDTMYYILNEGSSIYIKELAAAHKPSQEIVDFAVFNGCSGVTDLIKAGTLPSREALDFIGGQVEETEYVEKLRYGMPGTEAWKEKFIADGGDPAQAASALRDLIWKRNGCMSAEHSILETIGDMQAVPAYVLDYVAERLGAQPDEPLDELLDKSVHQNKAATVHLLLGAGAVPREDTLYFVLADDGKVSSLVKGTKSIKEVLIEACTPTPGMLDYLVRKKQDRHDIEELIKAGAEPALETVCFVIERLCETGNLSSKVYSNLPSDFSSEEYKKAFREAEEEARRLGEEIMKWQSIKQILEESFDGKAPLPLPKQSPLDEVFNDAALDKPQQPQTTAPVIVQTAKKRSAALLKGLRRRFFQL